MDKVELGIKLEQINELRQNGDYKAAAKVADTIEWRKVKKWSELSIAQEVYIKAGRPGDARNVCVHAYNRNLGGKRLVYNLAELSIQINDLAEAEDLYNEYVEMAPNDMERYVLLYKLNKAKGESIDRLISILEEYKRNELDEKYEYELACLYAQAGRTDDCVKECDDLILWFNDGDYVEKALRLKAQFAELTKSQKSKLRIMEEYRAAGVQYETILPDYDDEPADEEASVQNTADTVAPVKNDYEPPEKDYSVYDTQNVQAELARQMAVILAGEKPLPDDIQPAADLMSNIDPSNSVFPEIAREAEEAKEKAEEKQEEIEEPEETEEQKTPEEPEEEKKELSWKAGEPSEEPLVIPDDVDEPTKEIRVNTHHWNTFRSTMNEGTGTDNEKQMSDESGLPKYMTEQTITEGEAETAPAYVITDMETVVEEDLTDAGTAVHKEHSPVSGESASVTLEESETDIIKGQIDIMDWLEMGDDDNVGGGIINPDVPQPRKEEQPESDDTATDEVTDETACPPEYPEDSQNQKSAEESEDLKYDKDEQEADEEELLKAPRTFDTQDIEEALNKVQQQMMRGTIQGYDEDDQAVKAVMDDVSTMLRKAVDEAAAEESATLTPEPETTAEADTESEAGEEAVPESDSEADSFEEPESDSEPEEELAASSENPESSEEYNDFELDEQERKYLEKYLFINGLEENVAGIIHRKKRENNDGTSSCGNVAVIGNPKTDKTDFAISFIKALHSDTEEKTLRIAKTSAAAINKNGIGDISDKVKDMTLIIENAGQLTKQASHELSEWMETSPGVELVVITGEDFAVKRLFSENEKLAKMFEHRIEIRHYTVNELVAVAKEYARVKGYVISDKALLKVYLMISEIEGSNNGTEMEKVREIVTNAIEHNGKKPKLPKKMVSLKEKDFY